MRQRAQQLEWIRSSSGECGIDGVAGETFQEASLHAVIALQMIALQMTDLRLHCTRRLRRRFIARVRFRELLPAR